MTTDGITPYTAQIPDVDLKDLRARPGRVRWPDEIAEADLLVSDIRGFHNLR
jgi:hypothetical protein